MADMSVLNSAPDLEQTCGQTSRGGWQVERAEGRPLALCAHQTRAEERALVKISAEADVPAQACRRFLPFGQKNAVIRRTINTGEKGTDKRQRHIPQERQETEQR